MTLMTSRRSKQHLSFEKKPKEHTCPSLRERYNTFWGKVDCLTLCTELQDFKVLSLVLQKKMFIIQISITNACNKIVFQASQLNFMINNWHLIVQIVVIAVFLDNSKCIEFLKKHYVFF